MDLIVKSEDNPNPRILPMHQEILIMYGTKADFGRRITIDWMNELITRYNKETQ